jgi:16S rRNA (uracil1498-N3)-methyltransferase
LENLVISSSKQSRRLVFPKVEKCLSNAELMRFCINEQFDEVLVMYEHSQNSLKKQLSSILKLKKVAVIIGPEGGISDQEHQMFTDAKFMDFSLGETILKSATAATSTLALLLL